VATDAEIPGGGALLAGATPLATSARRGAAAKEARGSLLFGDGGRTPGATPGAAPGEPTPAKKAAAASSARARKKDAEGTPAAAKERATPAFESTRRITRSAAKRMSGAGEAR
jgi:hypothetical protein